MRVYLDGVFDMLHVGHVAMFHKARAVAPDVTLVVGVVRDEDVAHYKRTPIIPYKDRMTMVRECRAVDEVIEAELVISSEFLERNQLQLVIHGDDDTQSDFYAVPLEMGIMRYLPYTTSTSTTDIISRAIERGTHKKARAIEPPAPRDAPDGTDTGKESQQGGCRGRASNGDEFSMR